jgi:hypothetical protein
MRAGDTYVRDLFSRWGTLTTPPHMRPYLWGVKELSALWAHVSKAAHDSDHPPAFIGTIVLEESGDNSPGNAPTWRIVDGKQRIISLQLLIAALRDIAQAKELHYMAARAQHWIADATPWVAGIGQKVALAEPDGEVFNTSMTAGSSADLRARMGDADIPSIVRAYLYLSDRVKMFLRDVQSDSVNASIRDLLEAVGDIKLIVAEVAPQDRHIFHTFDRLNVLTSDPKGESVDVAHSVFVSYVREDSDSVDLIVGELESHGIRVWLDRTSLSVGDRWKAKIRNAIRQGDYFVACFSAAYTARERTYMNEELLVAIEELRLRPRDRRWFLPILLGPVKLPDHPIGPGETLGDIHSIDLSVDWDAGMANLLGVLT